MLGLSQFCNLVCGYSKFLIAIIFGVALLFSGPSKALHAGESCVENVSTVICNEDGSFTLELFLTNLTAFDIEYLFLLNDPLGFSISPGTLENMGVSPGGSTTISFDLGGAIIGDPICLEFSLHSPDLAECCFLNICITVSCGTTFIRSDCNTDGSCDIADAIFLLTLLFGGGGELDCVDACDCNDDGAVNIADAICKLSYLFSFGSTPAPPFPDCGDDPTLDPIDCTQFPPCP